MRLFQLIAVLDLPKVSGLNPFPEPSRRRKRTDSQAYDLSIVVSITDTSYQGV